MARLAAAERTTVYVIGDGPRACPAPEPRRSVPGGHPGCGLPDVRPGPRIGQDLKGLTQRLVVLDRRMTATGLPFFVTVTRSWVPETSSMTWLK
jgi:hypothetical protein